MKRTLALGSLAVAVTLTGCGETIVPAAKADLDARIASLPVSSTIIAAPRPGPITSMPPAAWQWTRYKMRLPNGEPKLFTEKLIGAGSNTYWYEIVDETYEGRTVEQLLVTFDNPTTPTRVELLAVRKKTAKGRVITVPHGQLWLLEHEQGTAEGLLRRHWSGLPRETTVVPAGRFEGCARRHTEVGIRRWRDVDDLWSHPAVPLSGGRAPRGLRRIRHGAGRLRHDRRSKRVLASGDRNVGCRNFKPRFRERPRTVTGPGTSFSST